MKVTKSFYTQSDIWGQLEEIASASGTSVSSVIARAIHEYLQHDFTRSSWDTMPEDDWYDEQRFYTYSQDKKGHSVTARFAIPKNVAGGIKRLVDSGYIPELRSAADFYRNAIFHWSRKVAQWVDDGELLDEMSWHQLQMEDATIRQTERDFENLIEGMRGNLDQFLQAKDYAYMETYMAHREEASAVIPEKFQAEYLKLLAMYRERLAMAKDGKLTYLDT